MQELRAEQTALYKQTRIANGQPSTDFGRRAKAFIAQPTAVTTSIAVLTIAVGVAQIFPFDISSWLGWYTPVSLAQPWRFFTWTLVHAGVLHLAFNMLVLFMVGPSIEQKIGKLPFFASYLVSAAGAAVAIAWLQPQTLVVGASGAIYALFGMAIGMQRMLGRVQPSLLIVVGINLVITFAFGGISWSAHVGGLLVGLALGFGFGIADRRMRSPKGIWLVIAGVAIVCLAVYVLRIVTPLYG